MDSFLQFIADSGALRRAAAALTAVLLPLLNQKLGLNVPSEQVIGAMTVLGGYVLQSSAHAISKAKATPPVTTAADAAKVLGGAP